MHQWPGGNLQKPSREEPMSSKPGRGRPSHEERLGAARPVFHQRRKICGLTVMSTSCGVASIPRRHVYYRATKIRSSHNFLNSPDLAVAVLDSVVEFFQQSKMKTWTNNHQWPYPILVHQNILYDSICFNDMSLAVGSMLGVIKLNFEKDIVKSKVVLLYHFIGSIVPIALFSQYLILRPSRHPFPPNVPASVYFVQYEPYIQMFNPGPYRKRGKHEFGQLTPNMHIACKRWSTRPYIRHMTSLNGQKIFLFSRKGNCNF